MTFTMNSTGPIKWSRIQGLLIAEQQIGDKLLKVTLPMQDDGSGAIECLDINDALRSELHAIDALESQQARLRASIGLCDFLSSRLSIVGCKFIFGITSIKVTTRPARVLIEVK